MSKLSMRKMPCFTNNAKADERFRHKQWAKQQQSAIRKDAKVKAEQTRWLQDVLFIAEYYPIR